VEIVRNRSGSWRRLLLCAKWHSSSISDYLSGSYSISLNGCHGVASEGCRVGQVWNIPKCEYLEIP